MKTKLIGEILATAVASFTMLAIAAGPVAAESPIYNTEYLDCCQTQNQSGWGRGYRGQGRDGWNYKGSYGRMYNLNTVETLRGEVVSIDTFQPRSRKSQGVHILVNTGTETVDVHLGPAWYLDNQDLTLKPKDNIEVRGSRIDFAGKPAIIAGEVKKGDATVRLRDEQGFPVWSGRRQRNLEF